MIIRPIVAILALCTVLSAAGCAPWWYGHPHHGGPRGPYVGGGGGYGPH